MSESCGGSVKLDAKLSCTYSITDKQKILKRIITNLLDGIMGQQQKYNFFSWNFSENITIIYKQTPQKTGCIKQCIRDDHTTRLMQWQYTIVVIVRSSELSTL